MVWEKTLPMSFNTKSHYADNSTLQKTVIQKAKPMLEDTIRDMCINSALPKRFTMADLGCSSGPNTLLPVINVIDIVHEICRENNLDMPEFQVFLNDLPDNDFNAVFRTIPSFLQNLKETKGDKYSHCSIAGVPGSFYDRLFPRNSLHFVHSSYSLHWLSQVPEGIADINKRNLYIGKSSPPQVIEAYAKQYEKDLSRFLRLRAVELTPGGRMVLVLHGRRTPVHTETHYFIDELTDALLQFVSEGVIKEENVDSLNLPSYSPYKDEMKKIIEMEGSFTLDRLKVFEMNWGAPMGASDDDDNVFDPNRSAKFLSKTMRAVTEPMMVAHFGDSIVDPLYDRYEKLVAQHLTDDRTLKFWNIALSLTKK